ncbi:hypothetical protein L208DRAFT_1298057 [Tricholoma matsutake]|nr:hypothetical protein L208DRAFT_1298057 [Tricholoma matsutake 945]
MLPGLRPLESEGSGDEYKDENSPESEEESEGESEVDKELEDEVNKQKAKKGRRSKSGRTDITAIQKTDPALGTPDITSTATRGNKRKTTDSINIERYSLTGLNNGWEEKLKRRASGTPSLATSALDFDESMVQYGGVIEEGETDDVEQAALGSHVKVLGKGRIGNDKHQFHTMVKIEPNHQPISVKTQKAARGGDTKWKIGHLPGGTADLFGSELIALAREKLGTLDAWAVLSVADTQDIVDRVYGEGKYVVSEDNVWYRLLSYRLGNWRNGFATAAVESVKTMIKDNAEFLSTEDDIQDYINFSLEEQTIKPLMTASFHWKEWNAGKKKKGFLQHHLILHTFTLVHLVGLEDIDDQTDDKLIGALILSMQAVGRALRLRKMGTSYSSSNTDTHFLADNYGDKVVRIKGPNGRWKHVPEKRAMGFVPTIKGWNQERWEDLIMEAKEFFPDKKKKGHVRSASQASLEAMDVEVEDFVMMSDEESLD